LETTGQPLRAAERDEVPTGHLIGGAAEAVLRDSALGLDREEPVVAGL
jgi:hypothetical protein